MQSLTFLYAITGHSIVQSMYCCCIAGVLCWELFVDRKLSFVISEHGQRGIQSYLVTTHLNTLYSTNSVQLVLWSLLKISASPSSILVDVHPWIFVFFAHVAIFYSMRNVNDGPFSRTAKIGCVYVCIHESSAMIESAVLVILASQLASSKYVDSPHFSGNAKRSSIKQTIMLLRRCLSSCTFFLDQQNSAVRYNRCFPCSSLSTNTEGYVCFLSPVMIDTDFEHFHFPIH